MKFCWLVLRRVCIHMPPKIRKFLRKSFIRIFQRFLLLVFGLCFINKKWRHVQRYWHSIIVLHLIPQEENRSMSFSLLYWPLLKEEVYFNGRYISEWTRKCFTKGWHGGKISRWNLSETDKVPLLFDNYLRIFINHQTVSYRILK